MMHAPTEILHVWNGFKHFPMERFTKIWVANKKLEQRQRTVAQMREHYEKYNITGNCFDLAIWLLDELRQQGIKAYAVGHDMMTEKAHVAVVAEDTEGFKYLCDLGDQWIQPICVDAASDAFHTNDCEGFFPGATIQVVPSEGETTILYKRKNGKVSKQTYDLQPIDDDTLLLAAEMSQRTLSEEPLFECRLYDGNRVEHWEFYNWQSFSSSMNGLVYDEPLDTIEEWAARIQEKSGYPIEFLIEVLSYYERFRERDKVEKFNR